MADLILLKAIIGNLTHSNHTIYGYAQSIGDKTANESRIEIKKLVSSAQQQQLVLRQTKLLVLLLERSRNCHCEGLDLKALITPERYRTQRYYRLPQVIASKPVLEIVFELISSLAKSDKPIGLNFRRRSGYLVLRLEGQSWLKQIKNSAKLNYANSLEQLTYFFLQRAIEQCGGRLHYAGNPRKLYLRLRLSTQLTIDIQ